ncbi:hypothetical protein BE11_35235 [Sorangium cellulosum]|nr:hypothetical protein BE11_35235 [Sorangium cellulosum]
MRGELSTAEDDTPRDVLQRDDETPRAQNEQLRRELAELRQARRRSHRRWSSSSPFSPASSRGRRWRAASPTCSIADFPGAIL